MRWSPALLAALGLLAASSLAVAAENVGAGASMGAGVTAFSPAPGPRLHVALPALELAAAPGPGTQLRVRAPVIEWIYAGVVRQQLQLSADLFVLRVGQCDCAVGKHVIRPLAGPMVGLRINAGPGVVQPGVRLGGRFGAEYLGPQRRVGLSLAVEPWFEARGGSAGPSRAASQSGGGAVMVVALTGYQAP